MTSGVQPTEAGSKIPQNSPLFRHFLCYDYELMLTRFLFIALFALLLPARAGEIFGSGTTWKMLKGTGPASSPANAWRAISFADGSWEQSAVSPFFYGEPLSGTELGDMRNNYSSIYLRKKFVISDPASLSDLILTTLSDDGFIAWINENEVFRYNMPDGDFAHDGNSLPALTEPIPWETKVISGVAEFLRPGENVIAVHAFNASLGGSSDFVFDATLSSTVDVSGPVIAEINPVDRALVRTLTSIEVFFNEPVKGVDASDLLIDSAPATTLENPAPGHYVFRFNEPATGDVSIRFAPNHGITDLASSPNAFAGASWSYNFDPTAPVPGVIISEFMADNDETINDVDGQNADWIELFNPTATAVNLNNWFLTINTNNPTQWRIPNVTLQANGYLVIFASEKDRRNPAAQLHTNFKIDKDRGSLALYDQRTNLVSSFINYPAQREDVSYGRERANPTLVGFFTTPTPGAPNLPGGPGFAPDVQFSIPGSTFINSVTVALSTTSPTAVIRYSLTSDLPTETSPIYTGPLTLNRTTQLRARAFQQGLLPGRPRTENYLAMNTALANFNSDLPIIILHNNGAGPVSASVNKLALMQVFEPKNGTSSMTNPPDLSGRAMFRLRGSSTQGYSKGSYALEMINEFGDDKKDELLGMPAESDWVFYAPNNFEPILIHNPWAHQLSRDIGRYSPRTRFAEVYLVTTTNMVASANYNGIYVIEEKIKRGPDRVDIDSLKPEHLRDPEVTGGYMMKIDRSDPEGGGFFAANQFLNYVDPKYVEISAPGREAQVNYIQNYMDAFGNALFDTNPSTGYRQFVNVPSWIDHHLLNVLTFNVDALRLSAYFYKPRGGKLEFGPLWDFDRALNSTDGRDLNPRVWRSTVSDRGTDFFNYPWWGEMFQDLEFFQEYIDRYQALRRNHFSTTNLWRLTDDLANQVRRAQPREQGRWGVTPRGGTYQAEVSSLRTWLSNRVTFMDSQFVPAPTITNAPGELITGAKVGIQAAAGVTVYYTTDGSDPRLPGGGVSPKAQLYSGPITVQDNIRLVTRANKPTHTSLTGPDNPPLSSKWSGAHAATFVVHLPTLVLTEIMYNPAPPPPGNTSTNELYEFIELQNRGGTAISLPGFRLTNGVDYIFTQASGVTSLAPGERLVVVKNRAAFISRYGANIRIAGEFTGSLNNAGDRLTLLGPLGEPIHDFEYNDRWYPITDGPGFSLVTAATGPHSDWPLPGNWRPSGKVHGTPGAGDDPLPEIAPVLINEVLTHTDLPAVDTVEIYNPTDGIVDISGWYLSDDFNNPRKYRFPPETRINPRSYLLRDESHFNAGAARFSLSSEGEQIYLYSANSTGDLTGYAHGFDFGAAVNGVTFGRHRTSVGRELLAAQIATSLGGQNSGPLVGPVVLNEILFHPPSLGTNDNTFDEFIELQNISSQQIPLFDPNAPANTWRLRGGVDFEFPRDASIPPQGFALVVNFDPAFIGMSNAFRMKFNLPDGVNLYGPYTGKLDNEGERITLERADTVDPLTGLAPYLEVDEVEYDIEVPWPAGTTNSLKSLQRLYGRFGDDPASWTAADQTAGAPTPGQNNPDRDSDGLPNDWELANGLNPDSALGEHGAGGDPDADGLNNLEEFQAGTDPKNPASTLAFTDIVKRLGKIELSIDARAGKSYSVWYRDSLSAGTWVKLGDFTSPTGGTTVMIDSAPIVNNRYYRLQLNP